MDLATVITEMISPLESSVVLQTRAKDSIGSWPPGYDTIHDTVAKRPISEGDTRETDSTERKFTHSSHDSDDESDIDTEPTYTIKDMTDLLRQIDSLHREQDELRLKQQIHEQHIKELLDREPCVHKHFTSWRKSFPTETKTKLISDLKNVSFSPMPPTNKKQQFILTEEHIYVQLEQLYANFHVLHFPSKTAQNILGVHKHNNLCDIYSISDMCLRNKVCALEDEKVTSTEKSLPSPQEESRLNDTKSLAVSKKLVFLPGRPTPTQKDLSPVEVTFKWTISSYSKKLRQEKVDEGRKEISSPFYLTHCGYRAQIEAYLNGNGTGTNRCMSVFLRIIKGDYDRHLKWPLNLHLVVILVNQSGDHIDSLKAEGNQFLYKRPSGSSDDESDCWGLIEFVSHEMIKQRQYIIDDKIELKCRAQFI